LYLIIARSVRLSDRLFGVSRKEGKEAPKGAKKLRKAIDNSQVGE